MRVRLKFLLTSGVFFFGGSWFGGCEKQERSPRDASIATTSFWPDTVPYFIEREYDSLALIQATDEVAEAVIYNVMKDYHIEFDSRKTPESTYSFGLNFVSAPDRRHISFKRNYLTYNGYNQPTYTRCYFSVFSYKDEHGMLDALPVYLRSRDMMVDRNGCGFVKGKSEARGDICLITYRHIIELDCNCIYIEDTERKILFDNLLKHAVLDRPLLYEFFSPCIFKRPDSKTGQRVPPSSNSTDSLTDPPSHKTP